MRTNATASQTRPPGPRGEHSRGARPPAGPTRPPRPARRRPRGPSDGRGRQLTLTAFVLVVLLVFAGRLVYLQVFRSEAIAADALAGRMKTPKSLPAVRGKIVDANGVVLATSVERYTLWVNQKQLMDWKPVSGGKSLPRGPEGAAALLAPVLGVGEAELGALLTGDRSYKVVAKDVLPATWDAIDELGIHGIGADLTMKRLYPADSVAGNVIGFVDANGAGSGGLERTYDSVLAGKPGTLLAERGRGGQRIPGGVTKETPAVPGEDIVLTTLRDLQWKAQEAIDKRVADMGAEWGAVVAIDIKTGEILALADSGTVNPNDVGKSKAADRYSRAVSSVFEPGSTAKVITMAAALETGVTTPTSHHIAPYAYTTENNQTFHDSHEHGKLKLTTTGVLAESSNTGTVQIGEKIPTQVRYDYLAKFGFGAKAGLGLDTEEPGILHAVENWDGRSKYAVLFGQSVAVTVVQITQVFATLGNGGVRVQPHLVKGFTAADGTFRPADPAGETRVVSKKTAGDVLTMLESAVGEGGTGTQAQIPGYRVAGKTGTAQAPDASGQMTKIVASFVGVAPADAPRVAVGVVVYDPKASIYGGAVSGPVFKDVTSYALQTLGVPPSGAPASLFPTTYK